MGFGEATAEPDSFNAAIDPDTCVGDTRTGAINFARFVAELGADKSAGLELGR
jgi:hypothetical protein